MRWSIVAFFSLCLVGPSLPATAQDDPSSAVAPDGLLIEEIRVLGLEWADEKIVLRELKSRVGEAFSAETVEEDERRLDRTDLFASIEIRPVIEGEGVVLEIELEETHPWVIFPIIAFSDENDPSYGAGARTLNALGKGISAGVTARFGGQDRISVFGKDPFITGNHLGVRAAISWGRRENVLNDFNEETWTGLVRVSSHIREHGRVAGKLTLESLKSEEDGRTLSPDNKDTLPTLALSVGYDTRDVYTDTRHGWWNELEIGRTGGDASYWTLVLDARRYQPVGDRQVLFLSSMMSLRSGELGVDIPIYQDYRFGGTNSIRGWDINQRRGKNQFISMAEFRYEIVPQRAIKILGHSLRTGVELAAFADVGSLWDEWSDFNRFIGGGGIGARILLPGVGRIRFDVGWGQSGAGARFHVDFGEKANKQRMRVR